MLASAVVILTALWAAVRSGLRVRDSMRDNSVAVRENTKMLNDLVSQGGRLDSLEDRVTKLEAVRRPARALRSALGYGPSPVVRCGEGG